MKCGDLQYGHSQSEKKLGLGDKYQRSIKVHTLESGIDVGQGINVGPGKFVKKNKRRALNKQNV